MSSAPQSHSGIVNFEGKSGERYRFQSYPMGTKFKAMGGIYIVTKRECVDRTFLTKASHRCLAIGQTADMAASMLTTAELSRLTKQGANCICVYAVADESRRAEIEQDLIEGNEQWGGGLHYLFRLPVAEKPPGPSVES